MPMESAHRPLPGLRQMVGDSGGLYLANAVIGFIFAAFDERKKGTIEVGKLADMVVLSADYMTVPEDQIKDIKPVMTIVADKVVYEAAD